MPTTSQVQTASGSGITLASTGNPNLTWETTTQNNIGVDLQFLGGALNLTADYYIKNTKDMLTCPEPLSVAGENAKMWVNTGKMKNRGWEIQARLLQPRLWRLLMERKYQLLAEQE